MQTCTLAVDIGASSGRHIVGTVQNGKITLQEVYRFENGVHRENGHLCWDIDTLAKEVVNGLKAAHDAGFAPATIGIDTWAVDFVLLDADNKRIGDAVAYRDERTEGIREALEKEWDRRHPGRAGPTAERDTFVRRSMRGFSKTLRARLVGLVLVLPLVVIVTIIVYVNYN